MGLWETKGLGFLGKVVNIISNTLTTIDEQEIKNKARHYLLYEHSSPLSEIMHQADIKAEMQYHKDIENACIASAMEILKWRHYRNSLGGLPLEE